MYRMVVETMRQEACRCQKLRHEPGYRAADLLTESELLGTRDVG